MNIAGNGITRIDAQPSAGNEFSAFPDFVDLYADTAAEVYAYASPMICISPPVVNVDDRVTYTFPTLGTTVMNGRQMSGFWTINTPASTTTYVIASYMFDQKMGFNEVRYTDRVIPYALGDGVKATVIVTAFQTGSFITGTSAPAGTNTFPIDYYTELHARLGTSVNNVDAGTFRERVFTRQSYESQWGTNSPANYGPFNFSTADLVTMEEYVTTGYGAVRRQASGGTNRLTVSDGFNLDLNQDEPVTMEVSSSIVSMPSTNVHVPYSKAWLWRSFPS
jgi:hypothetical protein